MADSRGDRWFAGKRVVLTGGSSGIGRSLALGLARRGASLILLARREAPLEEMLGLLEPLHSRHSQSFQVHALDVGDREVVERVLVEYDRECPVDVLINCAGVAWADYLERTPAEVFAEMIRVNYLGAVWTTLALAPAFRRRGAGVIANVASMAAATAFIGYAAYAPSKFALVGFSEAIRSELGPDGVQVSLLLPPDTRTPQLAAESLTRPAETTAIARWARVLDPEPVAEAFLNGIAAGRFLVIPGWDAWLSYQLARHLPGPTRWFLDRVVKRTRGRMNRK